jgi:hypothetical protein
VPVSAGESTDIARSPRPRVVHKSGLFARQHVERLTGLVADEAAGTKPNSLCSFSYDPTLYLADQALVLRGRVVPSVARIAAPLDLGIHEKSVFRIARRLPARAKWMKDRRREFLLEALERALERSSQERAEKRVTETLTLPVTAQEGPPDPGMLTWLQQHI